MEPSDQKVISCRALVTTAWLMNALRSLNIYRIKYRTPYLPDEVEFISKFTANKI